MKHSISLAGATLLPLQGGGSTSAEQSRAVITPARHLVAPGIVAALTTAALLAGCSSTAPLHATRVRTLELHSSDSVIVITHSPRELGMRDADLERWVWHAATAVQTYYGRFPVQRLNVDVEPTAGLGPQTGAAFGFGSPLIRMNVGRGSDADELAHRLDADP